MQRSARKERYQARIRAFRLSAPVVRAKQMVRLPGALVAWWRDRPGRFLHELAIGAIFKDEARFLDEWIAFHRGVGVEHFYLYDNGSSDNWRETLSPWITEGLVTVTDWPGAAMQGRAYNDCIRRFRRETRWIAFIDIDEFLFSPGERDLRRALLSYRHCPAVFVYWRMFGSSGHRTRPPGPVVEAYTRRLDDGAAEQKNGKSIVNPRLVRHMEVHWAKTWVGETVDENGRPPPHGPDKAGAVASREVFCINHYWSKSIEDLHDKLRRGDAATGEPRDLRRHIATEATLNAVEDRSILPIWEDIKKGRRPR